MKLSLVVSVSHRRSGRIVPITKSPFVIGRSQSCHLRPASAAVSKRHCAIWQRGERAIVRDLGSRNGTFVNGQRVLDGREIQDGDRLQIGPLSFDVRLRTRPATNEATSLPPSNPSADGKDREDEAALLLSELDEAAPALSGAWAARRFLVGQKSFEDFAVPESLWTAGWRKPIASARFMGDSSAAAHEILKRYLRRPPA